MPVQVSDSLDAEDSPPWLRSLLYAALFSASVLLASWTEAPDTQLTMLGPAAGVGALWMLGVINDRRQALVDGAVLACTAAAMTVLSGTAWGPALVDGLGHALQAALLAWLLHRVGRKRPWLRTPADLAVLVRSSLIACLLGVVLFALGTLWVAAQAGDGLNGTELAVVAAAIYARNLAWAVLIVAVGLRSTDPRATDDLERDLSRSDVPMILLTVSASMVILMGVSTEEPVLVLVPFPFLALLGERASTTLNTWMLAFLGAVVCTVTQFGYGPLAAFPSHQQPTGSQIFVLSSTIVVLTVSLLRDQRRDLRHRLVDARDELATRAHQVSDAEHHRELLTNRAPIGIATVQANTDGAVVIEANNQFLESLKYRNESVLGARAVDLLHPDDLARWHDLCSQAHEGDDQPPAQELRIRRRDGAYIFGRVAAALLSGEGEAPPRLLVMIEDITAQRQAERALGFSVAHDPVTKLANHMIFADRLHDALASSSRSQLAVGVLSIDIDGFRAVNEAVGHKAADHILATLAHRLTALVRPGDTVARLSGDIFAIICPETSTRGLEAVAHGVAEEMSKPVHLPQGQIRVTASVGAATATGGGAETARDMLRRAHSAMYRAKKAGRNRVVLAQADVITLRPR